MTPPVRLTLAAIRDLALAERWYREEAPHVLISFEEEVDRALRLISERPSMYPAVESSVRRALLRKFPFAVFYRIHCGCVEVVAVTHHSRDPRTWRRRV